MTSPTAPSLDDSDIRAFGAQQAVAATPAKAPRRRRRLWPWLLLAAALLAVVGAVVLAIDLVGPFGSGADGWHMSVDDVDVVIDGVGGMFGAVLAVGITAIVLLFVGAVLSLVLPLVLVAVLGALALVIGLPLLLLLAVLALLLSPLWLPVALLVWWLA